mmetsp:Transcript_40371/g.127338  ORF Transcript_40371/g.127338 Transcript_40371/m.127338 type:complete len:249 (+) Transcript_40371:574-1320(+)
MSPSLCTPARRCSWRPRSDELVKLQRGCPSRSQRHQKPTLCWQRSTTAARSTSRSCFWRSSRLFRRCETTASARSRPALSRATGSAEWPPRAPLLPASRAASSAAAAVEASPATAGAPLDSTSRGSAKLTAFSDWRRAFAATLSPSPRRVCWRSTSSLNSPASSNTYSRWDIADSCFIDAASREEPCDRSGWKSIALSLRPSVICTPRYSFSGVRMSCIAAATRRRTLAPFTPKWPSSCDLPFPLSPM